MEINDYSQRLAQARADYWDRSKSQKENYESDINNLENTHEYKEKKQADNYVNEKLKLEAENEAKSKFYADKTKREIENRQREFTDNLRSTESDYNRKNHELRDQFRDRLNRISSSFDNSMKQNNIKHSDELREIRNNYDARYDSAKGDFQSEIGDIRKTADDRFYDYQKNQSEEQKRMAQSHSDQILDINRGAARKLSVVKANHDKILDSSQKNFENEINLLQTNKENTVNQLKENHKASNDRMTENFEKVANNMEKRFVEDNKRMSRENVQALRDQEGKFNRDMAGVRAIASKNIQANTQKVNQSNLEKERVAEDYEGKLGRLKSEMDDYRYKQTRQLNKANADFTENLRVQKQENTDQMETLNRKHETYDSSNRARFRKDRAEAEARYLQAMKTTENQYEEKLTSQEKDYKDVIEANEKRHQHISQMMSENHDLALKDLNQNLQDEKTSFIEKTRRDVHDEKLDMKEELTQNFNLKNQALEQQLELKNDELERTVEGYEEKLAEIKKKAAKEFERYQTLASDRQIENQRSLKRTLNAKDQENSKLILEMKRRYDKEIAQIKFGHEVETKKMVEDYEKQLRLLKNESSKELEVKLGMAHEEYNNLKKNSELRLEAVKTQYELKLDKMRMAAQEANLNRGNRGTV